MAYRDLRDFLKKLEKEGELQRISAEVDPVLEITEITDRAMKAGGPALLFERPQGLADSGGDESGRHGAPDEPGAGSGFAGRGRGPNLFNPRHAIAARAARQNEDAAEACGAWHRSSPKRCEAASARKLCAPRDFRLFDFPDPAVLAPGRRPLHHLANGDHQESGNGQAKRGMLSHAGFRRAHHGNALADAEARRGAFSQRAGEEQGRKT